MKELGINRKSYEGEFISLFNAFASLERKAVAAHIRELVRVTKPGSTIYLATDTKSIKKEREDVLYAKDIVGERKINSFWPGNVTRVYKDNWLWELSQVWSLRRYQEVHFWGMRKTDGQGFLLSGSPVRSRLLTLNDEAELPRLWKKLVVLNHSSSPINEDTDESVLPVDVRERNHMLEGIAQEVALIQKALPQIESLSAAIKDFRVRNRQLNMFQMEKVQEERGSFVQALDEIIALLKLEKAREKI